MKTINAKELRSTLPEVVEKVKKGERFTVLYRSRPAFQIIPMNEAAEPLSELENDPLYRAAALGSSRDGLTAADHDRLLYGK
jgi:antitoxin (DNA-binding transcriptional repressor) of toxin-antitoxin stability system